MSSIDQLAAERKIEHEIEDACVRIIKDVSMIQEECNVTSTNFEFMKAVQSKLADVEFGTVQIRMALLVKRKETA